MILIFLIFVKNHIIFCFYRKATEQDSKTESPRIVTFGQVGGFTQIRFTLFEIFYFEKKN